MKSNYVNVRFSDDDIAMLDKINTELDSRYPLPDGFNRSETIRWCIRTAYGNLDVSQSRGKRSETP